MWIAVYANCQGYQCCPMVILVPTTTLNEDSAKNLGDLLEKNYSYSKNFQCI